MKNPLVLIIIDGFGLSDEKESNAIAKAQTPNIDRLFKENSHAKIQASGMSVGLPKGQMGNSEVGHTNIGAGRIVYQEYTRITKSIIDGDFFKNEILLEAVKNCKKNCSALHIMGLLSDGGVHSHNTHLYNILKLAKNEGLTDVYVHCFMDGRDVTPTSGKKFVEELEQKMKEVGIGQIATVIGRYYAMDRDNRWDRIKKAYDAMVLGVGYKNTNAKEAINNSYESGTTDEFIEPIICSDTKIKENDSVIFFNFRPDRAREITKAFTDENFDKFERKNGYFKVYFVCATQYDASLQNVNVAFSNRDLENTFGEYIANNGLKQLRIAETEKYAHVTFFFNGGREEAYENEDRALINSPKVATYDLKPEMSAHEVTEEVLKRINADKYDVIILNYANCDMVGHTGDMKATIKAVETVDYCLGKVIEKVISCNGVVLVTADHGNADKMLDENGNVFTAHSTNEVPFIVIGLDKKLKNNGKLADIAPTMLEILNLENPIQMDGESLFY